MPIKSICSDVEGYPKVIASKKFPGRKLTRIDNISYQELRASVANSTKYPYCVLMRERNDDDDETEVTTMLLIVYVGRWVNCIDVTSKEDKWNESLLRFNEDQMNKREVDRIPFAIYKYEIEHQVEEYWYVEEI